MKRFIILNIIFLAISGCVSMKQEQSNFPLEYRDNIANGRCEAAQARIPLEKNDSEFMRLYQTTLGYAVYISTLPVTVGLDALLMQRCRVGCHNLPINEALFPLSSRSYEYTKGLRCPDTSYYVQKYLEIVECYERRGDIASLEVAIDRLNYIKTEYNSGPSCLALRDYRVVDSSLDRVNEKLTFLNLKSNKAANPKK